MPIEGEGKGLEHESRAETTDELLEIAAQYLVPTPVGDRFVVEGDGTRVRDIEGREYIDCSAGPGVTGMGYSHPLIVEAVTAQARRLLQAPGGLLTAEAVRLAARLARLTPAHLPRSYFVNSGAEAVELAIKLAVKHQGAHGRSQLGLLAFELGFHGRSALALSLTGLGPMKKGLGGYASFPNVAHIPAPYCYRCPYAPSNGACCNRPINELRAIIQSGGDREWCALVVEPVLGVGGVVVPPDDFLPQVEAICREAGILLIVDEVFTGFGRTGRVFAHEHWSVEPDVMTVGKYLGGGLPMAAVVTTESIAASFEAGDHYTTFGGNNALACAAGAAALDVLISEDLAGNAERSGTLLLELLRAESEGSPIVGDVRGKGLLIGLEVVTDRASRAPAADLARQLREHLLENGVLVSLTGTSRNIIRITPPLTITTADVELIAAAFGDALKRMEAAMADPRNPGVA